MGTKVPRKLEQKTQTVGEKIKLARLRSNLSVAQVAERAACSSLTVVRIEKGAPTVAIGIYLLNIFYYICTKILNMTLQTTAIKGLTF